MSKEFVFGSKDKMKKRNEWWEPKISYNKKKRTLKKSDIKKYGAKNYRPKDPIPPEETALAVQYLEQIDKGFLGK